ncbi:flagella basal body P-ring formation protein FlgA [Sphingomonas sp. MMS12-HWE2-04]|uniref:flagella basal body P-ring formation protein FlgA n=1 Tax=Sphingomonas sp. MMS12-HWE2-04 TaxID=3234199 RepID=UPI00384F8409
MTRSLLALAMLAAATPAAAQDFQPTRVLDTIVAQYTGQPIGAVGGARAAVDPRLKLAHCPAPQLEWRNAAQDTVIVRCMAPAWRIFVPVNARAQPKPVTPAAQPAAAAAPVAKADPVIRRGDPVTIEAGTAGFSVTREGVAMNDAAPGARLMVKVDERKPPVQAIALETGRARLPGSGD